MYIHYCSLNNLYYGIVDIVDSALALSPYYAPTRKMRNVLAETFYLFSKRHLPQVTRTLIRYGYPNLRNGEIKTFCEDLAALMGGKESDDRALWDVQQLIKSAGQHDEMPFLSNNTGLSLIDDYSVNYLSRLSLFKNSYHVFDNETFIKRILDSYEILDGGKVCTRYRFEESTSDRFIQISDVLVGLLAKLFTFLNDVDMYDMDEAVRGLTKRQKESLRLLDELYEKSDKKNRTLITSLNPPSEALKRGMFLSYAGAL